MKKIILIVVSFIFALALPIIKPYKFYRYNYYISKITFNKKYLIVGLENGTILINDFKSNKTLNIIKLPKIHDFMGDLISMPIYSLDILKNKLLILAQGENASRIVFIYNLQTKKLKKIFTSKKTFMKASFINKNNIFLALLSDEVTLYNLKTNKFLYDTQVGNYVYSCYSLNENKTKAAIGDESGVIHIIDVNNGKKIADIYGYNKDKTIALDFVKNYIINGSSDKRVGIYDILTKSTITTYDAKFLPYAAAIAPNLKNYAIQNDENNDILLLTINSKPLALLKGHEMPISSMKFLKNNELLSYSPSEIIIWKIKEIQ